MTFAVLDVPQEAYDFISDKLRTAGYAPLTRTCSGTVIDMHGIALRAIPETPEKRLAALSAAIVDAFLFASEQAFIAGHISAYSLPKQGIEPAAECWDEYQIPEATKTLVNDAIAALAGFDE